MPGKGGDTSADNISPIVSTASSVFKHCLFGCKTEEELKALHNDLLHQDSGEVALGDIFRIFIKKRSSLFIKENIYSIEKWIISYHPGQRAGNSS